MRKTDLMDCPGAWYGCQPTAVFPHGHIIIDPVQTVAAIDWLRRRHWILDTKVTTDNGLCIGFQLKDQYVKSAKEALAA